MRILDRLAGPEPPRILCVDPRDTPVARAARASGGVHLAPLPGTNVALMNGLLHEIIAGGWIDRDYIDAHAVGFAELEKMVAGYTPERVGELCRLDPAQVRAAARLLVPFHYGYWDARDGAGPDGGPGRRSEPAHRFGSHLDWGPRRDDDQGRRRGMRRSARRRRIEQ